jgi:hypothetical protein
MKDGSRIMRSAINNINNFLNETDKPKDGGKVMGKVRGL